MSLFAKLQESMDKRDSDLLTPLYHDDYQFIRHQSGTTFNKEQMLGMITAMLANDAVQQNNYRCIYENDEVLVEHSVMDFPDGTREAVLAVHTIKDGRILKTETGATPLQK